MELAGISSIRTRNFWEKKRQEVKQLAVHTRSKLIGVGLVAAWSYAQRKTLTDSCTPCISVKASVEECVLALTARQKNSKLPALVLSKALMLRSYWNVKQTTDYKIHLNKGLSAS